MIRDAIRKVVERQDLDEREMELAVEEIMSREATPAQIASFITGLRMKGESVDEIVGAAKVMRRKVNRISVAVKDCVDTCGTGGDNKGTFNISTTSAFVACGAGVIVTKHGNRSVSSRCGSADVLKMAGVNIEAPVPVVERCIQEIGIGFLYAPLLHPAMKYAIGPRREIGIRTIFNILGPITNPAGAKRQVLGVYDRRLVRLLAEVLRRLGSEEVWVVHGEDGLDEISTTTNTIVARLKDGDIKEFVIHPEEFGIQKSSIEALKATSPEENVRILKSVLSGERSQYRDIVLLNAGAVIVCGGNAGDLTEGIKLAEESIDSGRAMEKLDRLIELTNR